MKKILLIVVAIATFGFTNAQTEQGQIFLEANTGFGAASPSNTGLYVSNKGSVTKYNIGVEGGYLVIDGLAIKLGVGYGDNGAKTKNTVLSFKAGAKYYLQDKFPIQLDVNGSSIKDEVNNPMYAGLQVGYAFFIGDHVTIEPGVRYDYSLNDKDTEDGVIQFNVGFVVHL